MKDDIDFNWNKESEEENLESPDESELEVEVKINDDEIVDHEEAEVDQEITNLDDGNSLDENFEVPIEEHFDDVSVQKEDLEDLVDVVEVDESSIEVNIIEESTKDDDDVADKESSDVDFQEESTTVEDDVIGSGDSVSET